MAALDCTLLADGSSDVALLPILRWVVRQHAAGMGVNCEWADMRQLPRPPRTLADRVIKANELRPCQVLFVHRDAESQPPAFRYDEVEQAVAEARRKGFLTPHVCVVPVRMQEAWLLLDEAAIRRASERKDAAHSSRSVWDRAHRRPQELASRAADECKWTPPTAEEEVPAGSPRPPGHRAHARLRLPSCAAGVSTPRE